MNGQFVSATPHQNDHEQIWEKMKSMADRLVLTRMMGAIRDLQIREESLEDLTVVAGQMLSLRDNLQFRDKRWFDMLTYHLATLDSIGAEPPAFDFETHVAGVVQDAVAAVKRLINSKLTEMLAE